MDNEVKMFNLLLTVCLAVLMLSFLFWVTPRIHNFVVESGIVENMTVEPIDLRSSEEQECASLCGVDYFYSKGNIFRSPTCYCGDGLMEESG